MTSILHTTGPVNLFRFIINPNHFGQSVENLYYMSCLFHEGICGFKITEDGEPITCESMKMSDLCESPTNPNHFDARSRRTMVFEFDVATWREAILIFDIRNSMIPHRQPVTV
ncbi:Non-structural maintenance of chromosome element 4 [Suillus cothurnatus]|nr:Non-structural maintenance of chromosome element 4 [Suillus cothurnatus]